MSDMIKRDQVFRLAATDAKAALHKARSIQDAWFRVQALAALIHQPVENPSDLAAEAEKAASKEADKYRAVAPMAWVVAALFSAGMNAHARKLLTRLRKECKSITPNTSMANTIVLLLEASYPHDAPTRSWAVESLQGLTIRDQDKRLRSALKEVQQIVSGEQPPRSFFN